MIKITPEIPDTITDEAIGRAASSAISDAHDNWGEIYGEPRLGNAPAFVEAMENLFIEYLTDETGCEPEEAVEVLNNCIQMQDEIALYTYTGRA